MAKLRIWIGLGKRRGNDPLHWIILLAPPDSSTSTWYHVTGGPTQNSEYKVMIQNGKRFDSHGISEHHYVGEIDEKDQKKFKASAQKVPAQQCQGWTVEVLGDLERKGLVPSGTADYWRHQVEAAGGSSSAAGGSSSATVAPEWVWDEERQEYRYWDGAAGQWVWASDAAQ